MSSYRIWAWIDRTSEDFVAVVAAVPDGGHERDVISLTELSGDERGARARLETLVKKARSMIHERGGEVLDVTMSKMPPQLRTMPEPREVLHERGDLHHHDPATRGTQPPLAIGFYYRKSRRGGFARSADRRPFGEPLPGPARIGRQRD